MRKTLAAVTATLALAGCATSLSTLPDRDTTAQTQALVGVPYSLPMLQYKLVFTRSLAGCPTTKTVKFDPGHTIELTSGSPAYALKADATAQYVPGERYVVDYGALTSPFKTSGFSFSVYPSGMLKSVNANAVDQTGDVIKSVVQTGLTVAALTTGAPEAAAVVAAAAAVAAPPAAPAVADNYAAMLELPKVLKPGKPEVDKIEALRMLREVAERKSTVIVGCTAEADSLMEKSTSNAKGQKAASKAVDASAKAVTRLTLIANLKAAKIDQATALQAALEASDSDTLKLKTLTDAGKQLDAQVTFTNTVYWPRAFDDMADDVPVPPDQIAKLKGFLAVKTVHELLPSQVKAWLDSLPPALGDELLKEKNIKAYFKKGRTPLDDPKDDGKCRGPDANVEGCFATQDWRAFAQLLPAPTGMETCTPNPTRECSASEVSVTQLGDDAPAGGFRANSSATAPVASLGRNGRDAIPDSGLFVRPPVLGIAFVCKGALPAAAGAAPPCAGKSLVFGSDPVATPQLGQLRFLPFVNKPFEANELALSMREDGSLDTFGYKKTQAEGTAATASLADAGTQYKTFKDAQKAQRQTDLTAARAEQIAEIQYQIDSLTKQKALLALQTPDPDQATKDAGARIDAQTALLNSQLAQLKAEAAVADALKSSSGS